MLGFSADLATFLYLLPVLLLWLVSARKDTGPAEAAKLVAVAVAGDLVLILLLSRLMSVQYAVVLARVLWGIGAIGVLARRYRRDKTRPQRPMWVDLWLGFELLLAVYVAVKLSAEMSRECHNADRGWHIPLAGSLRGQELPFSNVYDPTRPLAYHYTGDVLGVALSTLSGMRLHSSLALTLAHDILFGLVGVVATLLMRASGYRGMAAAVFSTLAILLTGPFTVVAHEPKLTSYSVVSFYRISFRPHVTLALLLLLGVVAALYARLPELTRVVQQKEKTWPRIGPSLIIMVAAMCVTDEATVALLGLGLGAVWLFEPRLIADTRWSAAAWMVGLAVAVVVPQVIFSGSLSPGAPSHDTDWVSPRAPGYYNAPIPLPGPNGRGKWSIIFDIGPQFLLLFAGAWATLRKPSRLRFAMLAFGGLVFGVAYVLLTRFDLDKMPVENHRFWTAPMLLLPALALFWFSQAKDVMPKALIVLSLVGSGLSTLDWIYAPTGKARLCTPPSRYRSPYDFYRVDCRKLAGARFGEPVHAAYLEAAAGYLYAGCRPTFTAGPTHRVWKDTAIGAAQSGPVALQDLHQNMVKPTDNLVVVCLRKNSKDPVCTEARKNPCTDAGRELLRCELTPEQRTDLLAKIGPKPKPETTEQAPADSPDL